MIKFKEVTWYSKLAAAIFFIGVLPTLTFYTGAQYGEVTGKLEMAEIFLPLPKSHKKDAGSEIVIVDFVESGHLAKNNPGLKTDAWYLVYEKQGAPALYKELVFDKQSTCSNNGKSGTCPDVLLPSSTLTQIKGIRNGDLVRVVKATTGN